VALGEYPGGRPTTLVALSGQGHVGYGEHVAFSDEEQQAFVLAVESLIAVAAGPVGAIVRPGTPPYQRAALEAAAIDLALRQAGLGLRDLCGVVEAPLRWVTSFAARLDPVEHLRTLPPGEYKVDVHPGWSAGTIAALAGEPVTILDFKEGAPGACAALSAALPGALFEDPPAGCGHGRVARDRPLVTEEDVRAAVGRGEAVNLKAPRMGGFLQLLPALAAAREQGGLAYLGGMFEAGPGREQARQIAALYCADAPNDLAPLAGALAGTAGPSPGRVRFDEVGFGATCDWTELEIG
jgi:hypothetical protein